MKKLLLIILILLPFSAFSSVYNVLKHPIDENPPLEISFDYINAFEDLVVKGTLEVLMVGDYLNHISGKALLSFFSTKLDIFHTIEVKESFALPSLQHNCLEWFSDNTKNTCKIKTPVIMEKPNPDFLIYEPLRILDIDFDGDKEIIIGTIGGDRGNHTYQIYEIGGLNKELKPTISFRGDAVFDKNKKTLTTQVSGNVCTNTTYIYQADGKGFKIIKKIDMDYFDKDNSSKCITKVLDF
tara:strand:+ start:379 stop:1098 length:720 start_codon:yes stop_codon:yes gene_type:complete